MYSRIGWTLAVSSPSVAHFSSAINGVIGGESLGLLFATHFAVGGSPMSVHSSAQDPIFYLAYAMIDRIYASWQVRRPGLVDQLSCTVIPLNFPLSDNVASKTDMLDWESFEAEPIELDDFMSTRDGPLCLHTIFGYLEKDIGIWVLVGER